MGSFSRLKLVSGGVAVSMVSCAVLAQHDGSLTAADRDAVRAWGQAYLQLVDNGTFAVGNDVISMSPSGALACPLFNPLRGPRWTLEKLGEVSVSDPDVLLMESPESMLSPDRVKVRTAMIKALEDGQVSTNAMSNPTGTQQHLASILDASAFADVTVQIVNNNLISWNLPYDALVAAGAPAQFAQGLSPTSAAAAAMVAFVAPNVGNVIDGVSDARARITGEPARSESFRDVAFFASTLGGYPIAQVRAEVLTANFDVFGSLPVVHLQFPDCFLLIDGINGSVTGPFERGSPIDPTSLLVQHAAYEPGTPFAVFSPSGFRMPNDVPYTLMSVTLPDGTIAPNPDNPQPGWVPQPSPRTTWETLQNISLPSRRSPKGTGFFAWIRSQLGIDFTTAASCLFKRETIYTRPNPTNPNGNPQKLRVTEECSMPGTCPDPAPLRTKGRDRIGEGVQVKCEITAEIIP